MFVWCQIKIIFLTKINFKTFLKQTNFLNYIQLDLFSRPLLSSCYLGSQLAWLLCLDVIPSHMMCNRPSQLTRSCHWQQIHVSFITSKHPEHSSIKILLRHWPSHCLCHVIYGYRKIGPSWFHLKKKKKKILPTTGRTEPHLLLTYFKKCHFPAGCMTEGAAWHKRRPCLPHIK